MKTYNIQIIKREMAMNVLELMTEGLETLLQIDDVLPTMAAPITRLDFENTPSEDLTLLMRSVRTFMKRWKRIDAYNKVGLIQLFSTEWLPNLDNSVKFKMLKESPLIGEVSSDGYVTIKEKNFNAYQQILNKGTFSHVDYSTGSNTSYSSSHGSVSTIGKGEFKEYYQKEENGVWSVDLPITKDEWYRIIKASSDKVKEYISCIIQLNKEEVDCWEIDQTFGLNNGSANARNSALGRLAMRMMGNFIIHDPKTPEKSSLWCIPMKNGHIKNTSEGRFFVWEARPEMLEAAREVLKEENFPQLKPVK